MRLHTSARATACEASARGWVGCLVLSGAWKLLLQACHTLVDGVADAAGGSGAVVLLRRRSVVSLVALLVSLRSGDMAGDARHDVF